MDHKLDESSVEDFSFNDKLINILVGVLYMLTSIISMILQIIIFLAFKKNPQILKNISYKIMSHIGYCNFLQQINFFLTSISIILLYDKIPILIEEIGGAICQMTFLMTIFFIVLLTLNCFDVFYQEKFFPSINREKFFNNGIKGCYVWGIFIFSLYLIPPFSMEYSYYEIGYNFRGESKIYLIAWEFENKVVLIFLTFSFFIYIMIVVKIHNLKRQQKSSIKSSFSIRDINFLIQAFLNFIIYVFIELLWEFGEEIFSDNRYIYISINYFFALTFSSNTFLCILIIREVREIIKKMFCHTNKEKISKLANKFSR